MKFLSLFPGKALVPRACRRWLRLRMGWRWFRGDHSSWMAARADSSGYEDSAVLEQVVAAARASRDGHAAWDRDGSIFLTPQTHAPLLNALRASSVAQKGRLHVVDFGGGLGGTWRQYRSELADLPEVRWSVVEQRHFVEVGMKEFSNRSLTFHLTLEDACERGHATLVLFSSVLQYLSHPHDILSEAVRRGICHVIIDRTPFWKGRRHRLTVQHTPPELGGGSYPCWLFDRMTLIEPLATTYQLSSEWPGFDDVDSDVQFHGMHFMRKPGAV